MGVFYCTVAPEGKAVDGPRSGPPLGRWTEAERLIQRGLDLDAPLSHARQFHLLLAELRCWQDRIDESETMLATLTGMFGMVSPDLQLTMTARAWTEFAAELERACAGPGRRAAAYRSVLRAYLDGSRDAWATAYASRDDPALPVVLRALVISTKTASAHVSNIIAKLGVSSRGEAAAWAHSHGAID